MAERLAGALAGHGEHEHARGSVVSDDDLRLVRVVVPFERDRVTSIVACVEFYEHASIVRLQPTTSHPCQTLGLPTGSTGRAPRGGEFWTGGAGPRMRLAAIGTLGATRGHPREPPRESP